MFCGAGCAGAHDEVVALAARLKAPIVHTLRGKEHIEYDNPFDVGMTGLVGFASGYKAMKNCDTLLDAGRRLSLPAILSRDMRRSRRSTSVPKRWAIVVRLNSACSARSRRPWPRLMPAVAEKTDARHLERGAGGLSQSARKRPRRACRKPSEQHQDPPAIRHAPGQRTGGRRRDLHLRRRHADRLDGALSEGQRQAPDRRLVQSRLDGQRDAARHRRAGGVSRAAGRFVVRRRRLHHDDGRFRHADRSSGCR